MIIEKSNPDVLSERLLKLQELSNENRVGIRLISLTGKEIYRNEFWNKYLFESFPLEMVFKKNISRRRIVNSDESLNFGKNKLVIYIEISNSSLEENLFFLNSNFFFGSGDKFCDLFFVFSFKDLDGFAANILEFINSCSFINYEYFSVSYFVLPNKLEYHSSNINDIGQRV